MNENPFDRRSGGRGAGGPFRPCDGVGVGEMEMRYRAAWYALVAIAIVLILFELFFRYRYVRAGDQVWRIDRVTEQACLVRVGDAICSSSAESRAAPKTRVNPYLVPPTAEPNP